MRGVRSHNWEVILDRARDLHAAFRARFYRPPTLRRLHYELSSDASAVDAGYRNELYDYKALSTSTAEGRRNGSFPDLAESARYLSRDRAFASAQEIRAYVRGLVRTDRMAGQTQSICVVVEKAGSRDFLHDWFGQYGVFMTALGGYPSQTLIDTIRAAQQRDGRRMLVLYAGDHDCSGEDIDRDFQSRLGVEGSIQVRRVALLPEHIEHYRLQRSPFDKDDTRARRFIQRHGGLWQTELDALDPDELRQLFEAEFFQVWDMSVYHQRLAVEADLLRDVLGQGEPTQTTERETIDLTDETSLDEVPFLDLYMHGLRVQEAISRRVQPPLEQLSDDDPW